MTHKQSLQHPDEVLEAILQTLRAHMPELRQRYGVRSLGVFGSYVHGRPSKRSDLDILVEFEWVPTLWQLSALQRHLSALVGIKVDLVLKRTLKPAIGRVILAEVIEV